MSNIIKLTNAILGLSYHSSAGTLKLVKSYLRSTMSEDRLTSLAHIYIHGQDVDVDEVIDSFAATGRHKLNFLK